MKVRELKELLTSFPDDMDIMIEATDREFRYNPLEVVEVRVVKLREDPLGEVLAKESYLILSDEMYTSSYDRRTT